MKIAFRNEHVWMGQKVGLLHRFWPNLMNTFTPVIMSSDSQYFRMNSKVNVTSDGITPLELTNWVLDYRNGSVAEHTLSQPISLKTHTHL
jgi:hypothetical protein